MRREIEIPSSRYSPGAYWSFAFDGYAEMCVVEYPAQLDPLSDDELLELAEEDRLGVHYVEKDSNQPANPAKGE